MNPAEVARRRRVLLLTVLLLVGLPVYLVTAGLIVGGLTAPGPSADGGFVAKPLHWAVELAIYLGLGLIWALPLKRLVQGAGRSAASQDDAAR